MIEKELLTSELQKRKKGGKVLPALCNVFGILILLFTIVSCLPMVLPPLWGYEVYNVVSGSMEPEIPVGSILYVEKAAPEDLVEGDIIAFQSGNSVIAHRVVDNDRVEGELTTKGDANAGEDMNAVDYQAVIGIVAKHYPMLGTLMDMYSSFLGKVYLLIFAACGAMLNILASRIRDRRRQD